MKKSFFIALTISAFIAIPAWATGSPPVVQPPPSSPEYNVDLSAGAVAGAAAGAKASSNATGTGIGVGLGGAGGDGGTGIGGTGIGGTAQGGSAQGGDAKAGSYSAGGQNALNNNSKTGVYVLPPPVWTMVPQAAGCIVTSARSLSGGWSFISAARSDQKSDPACVGIILAKAAYDHCHFKSEAMIMQRVYATVFPGGDSLPIDPATRNHTLAECEELKRPRLTMTGTITPPASQEPAPRALPPKADRQ